MNKSEILLINLILVLIFQLSKVTVYSQVEPWNSTYSVEQLKDLRQDVAKSIKVSKYFSKDYIGIETDKGEVLIEIDFDPKKNNNISYYYKIVNKGLMSTMTNTKETDFYDGKGQLEKRIRENLDTEEKEIIYYLNNKLLKIEKYDKSGELMTIMEHKFIGNEKSRMFRNADYIGEPSYFQKWRYDESGNEIEFAEIFNGEEGIFKRSYQYIYSADGKILEQINFDIHEKKTSKSVFSYNENNKLIECLNYDPFDNLIETRSYKFNDKGEIVSWNTFNIASNTFESNFEYSYGYDHNGNWNKLVISKNGKDVYTIIRQIEY